VAAQIARVLGKKKRKRFLRFSLDKFALVCYNRKFAPGTARRNLSSVILTNFKATSGYPKVALVYQFD